MMFLIKEGGFFILPLLACSILMVAIIIERFFIYSAYMKKPLTSYETPIEVVETLKKRLIMLNTIIMIAPLLGLLGTVTGLMKCFHLLGTEVTIYNPQQISLGISEALLTTAVGLIITVIGLVFYNYFNSLLENYIYHYNLQLEEEKDE